MSSPPPSGIGAPAPGDEMPTDRRLVLAAERLFAERGIDAVSLRAVMSAAGTNVASVHYHFGSKEALVEAVIRHRSEAVAHRRQALLDALEAAATVTPRALAEAFVVPVWEQVDAGESAWVRLIAGILSSGHPALSVITDGFTDQAVRFLALFDRAVPGTPAPTARFRLSEAMTLTFGVLGDLPRTRSLLSRTGVDLAPAQVVEELLDVVTAILAGPPPS